jgi:hypothetical protein
MRKVAISHKARRLVERAIRLAIQHETTSFYTGASGTLDAATINAKRRAAERAQTSLTRRTILAKQVLLEYIEKLENL